ncbi:MAG: type IV pilus biogenesis/stability protein PilW [marine bacterium B5-7]|nr:MAG: type IV pilus biogenesis/stability protein PilW [marine bacterium B5-7]
MALVGAVGQTVNNAAYNSAERDLNNPKINRNDQALEVAVANMNLGIEYMQQGAYENALTRLERSLLAKPDYAPTYNILGLLYQRLGDPVESENNFKKSLALDSSGSSSSSTHNNYGLLLCNNGRIDEAEAEFLDAANNPLYNSPEIALTNAGLCLYDNKPQIGEGYFKQALNKNPRFSHALIQMADISYNRNEYVLAHQYFKRYQSSARHTPKSLWLGIQICKELNFKDDVSSYALLLRNQYPDTIEAKKLSELQL